MLCKFEMPPGCLAALEQVLLEHQGVFALATDRG